MRCHMKIEFTDPVKALTALVTPEGQFLALALPLMTTQRARVSKHLLARATRVALGSALLLMVYDPEGRR